MNWRAMGPKAWGAMLIALGGAALVGGCNYFAAGYLLVHGPPKYPAQHELDASRATVVFVDDRANRLPRRSLRQRVGEAAEQSLLENKAVKDAIASRGAILAANQERFSEPMSLVEIGRSVGASVLISVVVDGFTLSVDGQTFAPMANVRVKVVDVESGERLWPEEPQGKAITAQMPQQQGSMPRDRAEVLRAQEQLAVWTGVRVAQLFYEHEVRQSHGG